MVFTIEQALQSKDQEMLLERNRLKSFDKGWIFADGKCSKENVSEICHINGLIIS